MAESSHRGLGRRGTALLVVLLAALVAWVVMVRRAPTDAAAPTGDILEHVPADAFLVAVVDVERLRQTDLGRRLLGDGRRVAGLGEIQQLCGRDPMDEVQRLVVAVPEGSNTGFGLFADGALVASDLLACAERIVTERGGRPVRQARGRFSVLKDAGAALSSAQVAVADGGPLVLGEPPYVEASLRLAEGEGASIAQSERHAELRRGLEGDVIRATVVLSAEQRATLRDELQVQRMADSPFRSVAAAGLGVGLTPDLAIHAVLVCDEAGAATQVAAALDEARRGEAATTAASVSGLDDVLERVAVTTEGPQVHLKLRIPVDEALALVQRLLALQRLARGGIPVPAPTASGSASPGEGGARP